MTLVNVYLNFDGNCEEAFIFYKSVFGGEFGYVGRFGDMPPGETSAGGDMPAVDSEGDARPVDPNRIMHISLPISKETALMGSDTGGDWALSYNAGNNFSISVSTDTREEADRIFNALSEGGQVTMPMNNTFWGDYFGMCTDPFGVNWMMSFNDKQNKGMQEQQQSQPTQQQTDLQQL